MRRSFGLQCYPAVDKRILEMGSGGQCDRLADRLLFHAPLAARFCLPDKYRLGDLSALQNSVTFDFNAYSLVSVHQSSHSQSGRFSAV